MLTSFYKLSESPFQLTPDHRYFFPSSVHRKAMGYLTYGVAQGEGFVVITGEVGAGKTTLAGHLMSTLDRKEFVTANVVSTQVGGDDMLRLIAGSFGISHEGVTKATLLQRMESFLVDIKRRRLRALAIIDESQNIGIEALEELRMLSNLAASDGALLQSMLLGQPQFREKLNRPELSQLRQRIIASYHLGPMTLEETESYVRHRLTVAGWINDPWITDDAFATVHEITGGVPRLINLLFGRILLFGELEELHRITGAEVRAVADDMSNESAPFVTPKSAGSS